MFFVRFSFLVLAASLALGCSPAQAQSEVPVFPVEVRQLADGFGFVEGPVWNSRGFYLFSDIPKNTLWKITSTGKTEVIRQPTGNSNGSAYDFVGRLISCERTRVARKASDHEFHTLAESYKGKKLNSPNDLALFRDGSIFFSDPTYGSLQKELDFRGLYRIHPDGKLQLLDKEWQQPNGLCFSPDWKRLYVGDSQAGQIFAFDVNASGEISNRTLFASIPKPGDPDGMKCDAKGRLFVAAPKGVRVYSTSGELLGLIPVPKDAANLCFGGAKGNQLFITARETVYLADLSKWQAQGSN